MFKVNGVEYTFSTWFTKVSGKELTNILLLAKSEKEVVKNVKEVYLQKGLHNKEIILGYIKSLIQKYKTKDKGSQEWIVFIKEYFEKKKMYEVGMTKERTKEILNTICG